MLNTNNSQGFYLYCIWLFYIKMTYNYGIWFMTKLKSVKKICVCVPGEIYIMARSVRLSEW